MDIGIEIINLEKDVRTAPTGCNDSRMFVCGDLNVLLSSQEVEPP